jgi:predicted phage terminase large subunit-like protein
VEPAALVPGWHIDAICEHLEAVTRGQIQNLLITVPPRHGKSTMVSVIWPSWEWIEHPERRWLLASYAESLAIRDNVRSRRLIGSNWYQGNWGGNYELSEDVNNRRRMETTHGGHRIALGTGGSATGEGGDRLILDDPHNLADTGDVVRRGVLDWYDQVWSTRGNDPKTATKVIIMQRFHTEDLAGHVLKQGGWEHLSIAEEYEGGAPKPKTVIGWSDPRTTEGELLWPARYGSEAIERVRRTLGSMAYAGQYQQRPLPAGGGVWKQSWFRFYRHSELAAITRFDSVVASWDCAFKDLHNSDYVCGQLWAVRKADFYLLDEIHARLDFPATLAGIRSLCARSKDLIHAVLVEDKANGSAVISVLRREIPGMLAINPEGGKQARAAAVAPLIEAGNVYLPMPDEQPWIEDTLLEFVSFPAAAHDDRVDAASQALHWLQAKRRGLDTAFLDAVAAANQDLVTGSAYHQDSLVGYSNSESARVLRERWSG